MAPPGSGKPSAAPSAAPARGIMSEGDGGMDDEEEEDDEGPLVVSKGDSVSTRPSDEHVTTS
eukprot:1182397-Prorocentrum_minimum.AAC.2